VSPLSCPAVDSHALHHPAAAETSRASNDHRDRQVDTAVVNRPRSKAIITGFDLLRPTARADDVRGRHRLNEDTEEVAEVVAEMTTGSADGAILGAEVPRGEIGAGATRAAGLPGEEAEIMLCGEKAHHRDVEKEEEEAVVAAVVVVDDGARAMTATIATAREVGRAAQTGVQDGGEGLGFLIGSVNLMDYTTQKHVERAIQLSIPSKQSNARPRFQSPYPIDAPLRAEAALLSLCVHWDWYVE
jgi:hypothetical protein